MATETATHSISALELLRGVTYLGHTEDDGVTLCVMHEGLTHLLRGQRLQVHGDLAEGRRIAVLQVQNQFRVTVLP